MLEASLAALEEAAATTATLVSRCAGDSGGASEEQTVDVKLLPNVDGTANGQHCSRCAGQLSYATAKYLGRFQEAPSQHRHT